MDAVRGIETGLIPVIAFLDNIGTVEMIIVAVVALLVFGKRLPEVASQAGATLTKFRRGLDGAIQDSGVQNEIRKIKDAMPTDMSVKDLTRVAARKLEDRLRDTLEPPAADGSPPAADAATPSTEANPAPPAAAGSNGSVESAPHASPDLAPKANTDPASKANTDPAPQANTVIAPKPGIDPASRFVPPGSVPRE
jgi:TatA/E family protein of Tat protein translocase